MIFSLIGPAGGGSAWSKLVLNAPAMGGPTAEAAALSRLAGAAEAAAGATAGAAAKAAEKAAAKAAAEAAGAAR